MAFEFITNPIFGALDLAFMPFINTLGSIIGVFIIASIVAFVITVANKLLVNQDRLEFLKNEMQGFQQEMMAAQKSKDPKLMAEAQNKQAEFMKIQKEMMFNSFKPMIVTFVPIILIFWWMAQEPAITSMVVKLPTIVYYVLLVPVWHFFYQQSPGVPVQAIEWLGWYILCSFAMSLIFRKYLGLKGGM
jgi:uncharacterized membrane protein (DUF106 family)